MKPKLAVDAVWRIQEADHPSRFGTLGWNKVNRLELTVKIPAESSLKHEICSSDESAGTRNVPELIRGRDANNKPVMLFGCFAARELSAGLMIYKIHVLAAVQGLEFTSWSEESIHAASFKVDLLHRWLDSKIAHVLRMQDGSETWTASAESDLLFDLAPGIQLRIVRFVAPSWSLDEYKWTARPRVWLHFDQPQSLDALTSNWVPLITRFFSLLIGTSVEHDDLECYREDPYVKSSRQLPVEGKLFRTGRKHKPPQDLTIHSMLASYPDIADSMPQIIKQWQSVASRLEAVIDLFSTVTFHQSLHSSAQFLFLVQAIEVYHSRSFESFSVRPEQHRSRVKAVLDAIPKELYGWVQSRLQGENFKRLDERISELFERHSNDVRRIFKNREELPERIRYTRNYLTHYNGDPNSPKYLSDAEMVEVNWGLRALLWMCLLKEVGISGNHIERLIRRHTVGVRFVNLA
jgi:hypothetical protein